MKGIRHQFLEPNVLHASYIFGTVEILRSIVSSLLTLTLVVHQVLGHLTQCPPFLPEVDNDTCSSFLRCLDALLDAVEEIWTAGADVGSEDVGAIAFVVDTDGYCEEVCVWGGGEESKWYSMGSESRARCGRAREWNVRFGRRRETSGN